jgi:rfaE bifunctional protein kinase chain/domain
VTLVTLVGRDDAGRRVREALPSGVSRRGLLTPAGFQTPVKTRILAGGVHSAKQQVVRIDRMSPSRITAADRAAIRKAALAALPSADAVLMSDYGSGIVTPALGRAVGAAARRLGIPVLVDSRYALTKFRGLTACAPNESEVEAALGVDLNESPRALEAAGRTLLSQTRMRAVVITRGSRGMAVFEPDQPTVHLPIYGSDEIADVTGAGDTVMATLTLAMAAGASAAEAARMANVAGGLVVMKRGTATVSAAELSRALAHG